jgi:hypothetical protein
LRHLAEKNMHYFGTARVGLHFGPYFHKLTLPTGQHHRYLWTAHTTRVT